jgi:uncharacterized repeat protein (TIGR02543 family)
MKHFVRLVLALVLCPVLGLSGVLVGIPAVRAADTGSWAAANTGLTGMNVLCFAINPQNPSTLYAGTDIGGVFLSVDSGATWIAVNTGLASTYVPALAINPLDPSTVYASNDSSVFRSSDSGATWTAAGPTWTPADTADGTAAGVVLCFAINPRNPSTLYAGTDTGGVFRSTDSGATWTAVNTGLTTTYISALAINPLNPSTLYAGTDDGVFLSVDSGATWTAAGPIDGVVLCFAINPLNPSIMYAGSNIGVFCSTDSGTTWTEVNTDIANPQTSSLAINPLNPSTLYAGTDSGVFLSVDSGATWTAAGPADGVVICLAINPLNPSTVYSSTDNGVSRYASVSSYVLIAIASPASGGSIGWSPKTASYTPGTVVTLTASPTAGYVFTGWSGALSGTKNPTTVTMDADKKVTASFTAKAKSVILLKIGSRTMYVDGKPIILEAAPIILHSRTLLPIRAVVEATGGTIAWEASTRKVTIVRKDKTLVLWIGKNMAKLNGQSVNIDSDPKVVPIIMNGRTLLPLRFVAEELAMNIQWNATTQAITITYTP